MTAIRRAADMLDSLASRRYRVTVEDGLLCVRGGDGTLSEVEKLEIRAQKPALIDLIEDRRRTRAQPCSGCGRFSFIEPVAVAGCYWCRQGAHETPAADAARAETPRTPPTIDRPCPSCGGGLQSGDLDGSQCWSCQQHAPRPER